MLPWIGCYGVIFAGTIPAYILGWDWGRWVDATSTTFLLVWLALREQDVAPFAAQAAQPFRPQLQRHQVSSRIARAAQAWSRFVEAHRTATLSVLLLFALTFHLPELYLDDRQAFIVKFGFDLVRSLLHRHDSPLR